MGFEGLESVPGNWHFSVLLLDTKISETNFIKVDFFIFLLHCLKIHELVVFLLSEFHLSVDTLENLFVVFWSVFGLFFHIYLSN